MNIMVFNVPAETVGALSILNEFYEEIKLNKKKEDNWIFVLSKPKLEELENIKVLRFPWIKKSWFHRLFFDHFIAPKLIEKYNIHKIVSFQNVIIPHTNVNQILYVHNSLPFSNHKFKLLKNKHLWIYQNVISKNIIKSIKKADKVIVQTNWMRDACIKRTDIKIEKIEVVRPNINLSINHYFEPSKESLSTFFYPASEFEYKNHRIIIDVCKRLKEHNISEYKVIFTLSGNENKHIQQLYKETIDNQLPIKFVGRLPREYVFDLYTKSVLLFPSYIETVGLPMLEARLYKGIVIASDCPFSHEILDNYENAYFFNPFDEEGLFEIMKSMITNYNINNYSILANTFELNNKKLVEVI